MKEQQIQVIITATYGTNKNRSGLNTMIALLQRLMKKICYLKLTESQTQLRMHAVFSIEIKFIKLTIKQIQ